MPESTLQQPAAPASTPSTTAAAPRTTAWRLGGWGGVVLTGIALLGVSTLIVVWARTRPGYDPYGWLVWGQQTLTGSLNTNAAPSWKPLPYLFTVPFAIVGHYQLWLWMITSVAAALAGAIFAARIAYRVVASGSQRRWPAYVAGAFAAAALLGIHNYAHFYLSSQSDPMIVALVLGAIDCHLGNHPRWAFALGVLASLGRPEAWPFTGLYAIWMWRALPNTRWFVGGGLAAIVLLWFGIPALTSRSAFVAGDNALGSGRALHHNQVFGTIDRFLDLHETPLELAALLSLVIAVWRRDRVTLVIAAGAAGWVLVEVAFSLHGWPGDGRYMFPAAGVLAVVAAVAVGRLLADPPKLQSAAGVVGIALVAVLIGSLVPAAVTHAREERTDLKAQRLRTKEINRLRGSISRAGGAALIRHCGEPLTRLEYQSIVAWNLRVNVATVGFRYAQSIARGNPIVLITPEPNDWKIQAMHQRRPECRALPS